LLVSVLYVAVRRLLKLVVLFARSDREKELEILVLRHELSIVRRQVGRPSLEPHDRLLLAALSRVLPRRRWNVFLVRPETLLRWHRRLVARSWTYSHRRPGRPAIGGEVRELIVRLAREDTSWGYLRIVGELRKLGIGVSATSVRNILAKAGLPSAPQRDRESWRAFLRAHGESILACDFFTVDSVWLRRLHVLVFLSIGSRRIEYLACTSKPNTAWMLQQARNLLMELDDRDRRVRFLIHDRDTKFPRAFDALLASEHIKVVHTPVRAPNANAHMERWVGSVRRECLDRLLIVSRRQLQHVLRTYVQHYNRQRPHRALDLKPPDASAQPAVPSRRLKPAQPSTAAARPTRRAHPRVRGRRRSVMTEFLHSTGRRLRRLAERLAPHAGP
jgi:putative transposase